MSTVSITAMPVDMRSFQRLLASISPEFSVCVRGRHAVGKSEGVYQAAQNMRSEFFREPSNCAAMLRAFGGRVKTPQGWVTEWNYDMGLPVVERRLSQMTEGDIIGLPYMEGKDTFDDNGNRVSYSSTQFKPCDWLITSCEFPVLLFLDERNRALDGVKQAVFQLTDSKAFYGYHLNDETRIVIAENDGDEYQVQACDPAEVSRCATVSLEPTVKDWLEYASDKCHDATIEFIREHSELLEHKGAHEPGKKYPDRRSWFKLDSELQRLELFDNPGDHMLYVLSGAFLGVDVAGKFQKYVRERDRSIKATDILSDWSKAKRRLGGPRGNISNEMFVECTEKIASLIKKGHELTFEECEQYAYFVRDCPAEVVLQTWSAMQKNSKGMLMLHKFIERILMHAVSAQDYKHVLIPTASDVREGKSCSESLNSGKPMPKKPAKKATEDVGEPKKKRGARRK